MIPDITQIFQDPFNSQYYGLTVFALAVAIDLVLGEPPVKVHPVVLIGRLISSLREAPRPKKSWGILLALTVIAITVASGHVLVWAAGAVFPLLGVVVAAYLLKSTFALRCLMETSASIGEMIDHDLDSAKEMLPALVGRDTKRLDPALARSAVIESLSENYVDSVLSPIFYFLVFQNFGLGLEAALAFKAMSTMDSMLGYKTKGLKELGFAAARLDDLANFLPARLSVPIIAIANPKRAKEAVMAALKYHKATPSPNSGWPMSAAAGSLGIKLEKPGYYVLLNNGPMPGPQDIQRSLMLMGRAIALTIIVSVLVLALS